MVRRIRSSFAPGERRDRRKGRVRSTVVLPWLERELDSASKCVIEDIYEDIDGSGCTVEYSYPLVD